MLFMLLHGMLVSIKFSDILTLFPELITDVTHFFPGKISDALVRYIVAEPIGSVVQKIELQG